MQNKTRTAWIFLTPMLVVLALVALWPLGRTIWFSFTDANINDLSATKFIGLENYVGDYGLFANPNNTDGFWASDWGVSILNTLKFSVVSVTLETLLGLGVAMLLNQDFKGRNWVRAAVLVPCGVLSGLAVMVAPWIPWPWAWVGLVAVGDGAASGVRSALYAEVPRRGDPERRGTVMSLVSSANRAGATLASALVPVVTAAAGLAASMTGAGVAMVLVASAWARPRRRARSVTSDEVAHDS